MQTFQPIPLVGLTPPQAIRAMRTNCLGSLFYFIKVALKRKRLTEHLHLPLCRALESERIKDIIEWPRDHFKTTIASEGLPMWNALPFSAQDEAELRRLGYGGEFIIWMKRVHDPCTRILLVSENITNASKLGTRIRRHFESNAIYRALFPETLPDASCIWTNYSLHVKRPANSDPHGEGTFDFLGVGGALQSRHYKKIIQDDLVGRKAVESPSIMEKTVEYHQLVAGAFDQEDATLENDEIVIGNRWSFHDMNSWIRENESYFRVTRHAALGGCCPQHPADTPIFPEEFSFEKLQRLRTRLGSYMFSCQFLNDPAAPENSEFKQEWISTFRLVEDPISNERVIKHVVTDGVVRRDLNVSKLSLTMVTDPAHATNQASGRCRHAIIVLGQSGEGNYYLLEAVAIQGDYTKYFDKLFQVAQKWRIRKVGFETVCAQKFAAYHINYLNRFKPWPVRIVELKGEVEAPDGTLSRKKEWRIRNVLSPIFEFGRFFMQKNENGIVHQDFLAEFTTFPKGRFVDQLDALAYAPQMLRVPYNSEVYRDALSRNRADSQLLGQRYSAGGGMTQ